jgi:hypothetical protein
LKGLANKFKNNDNVIGDFARIYNQFDLMASGPGSSDGENSIDDTVTVNYGRDNNYDGNFLENTNTT